MLGDHPDKGRAALTLVELSQRTVAQLRALCVANGLRVGGRKADLIARLHGGDEAEGEAAPAVSVRVPGGIETASKNGASVLAIETAPERDCDGTSEDQSKDDEPPQASQFWGTNAGGSEESDEESDEHSESTSYDEQDV